MYEIIKAEATKRGLSIRQLEIRSNVGDGTIGRWRKSSPTLDTLDKVADTLGLKPETLIARRRK